MSCVNKSSKEFKALAAINGISSNTLELITHKYWNEKGDSESFPPNLYIQAQLGGLQYVESSEDVIKLYNKDYKEPLVFDTLQELQDAKQKALKFFPSEAIYHYETNHNQYVLVVKEPVQNIKDVPVKKENLSDTRASYHIDYWKLRDTRKKQLETIFSNTKNLSLPRAREILKVFNMKNNTNFGLTKDMIIVDKIPEIYTDLVSKDEKSIATQDQMNNLFNFLQQLFPGIKIKTFEAQRPDETKDRKPTLHDFLNDYGLDTNAEAVLIGDTIYTSKSLRDADVLLEEFLHPLIEIIYNDKRDFFNSALQEAKTLFSLLDKQIQESYSDARGYNQTIRDKELVTQVLSRWFRDSLGKTKDRHNSFEYFVRKFIRLVKDLFNNLVQPSIKTKNGIAVIPIESLTNIWSLKDLADALNTKGISIDVRKGFQRSATYHLTSPHIDESKYDIERLDNHRIGIYKKYDFVTPKSTKGIHVDKAPILTAKQWQLFKDHDWSDDIANEDLNHFTSLYGKEDGKLLWSLANEFSAEEIDIEETDRQNKQERLVAVWDDREGELFPELSFFNIADSVTPNSIDNSLNKNDSEEKSSLSDENLENQNTETEGKKQMQKTLDEYDKLNQQIDNLLSSNIITASEVRHIATLIVNSISDMITQYQERPDLPFKQYEDLHTNLDFATASRKEIVQAIGIENILERAQVLFEPENNDYIHDVDTLLQCALITDNWDAIITLASDVFVTNEGFGISKDMNTGRFVVSEAENIDYDNFNESEDEDSIAETEGDTQEHWQIESRTLDTLEHMSDLVRREINKCYLLDKDGNKVLSKFGIPERVNARAVINSIFHWTKGNSSISEIIASLQSKQKSNPWVSQLISKLADTSGKYSSFQSQFFGVFCKDFQKYSVVTRDNNKYASINVNNRPVLSEAIKTISALVALKQHPLFTPKGLNSELLGSVNDDSNKSFSLHGAANLLKTVKDNIKHQKELSPELLQAATLNIMAACRTFGYNVTEDIVSEALSDTALVNMATNLDIIVRVLDKRRTEEHNNPKERGKYDPFAFSNGTGIAGALRKFLSPIIDILEDAAINAFYDSGKMYQSYVTPSFVTQLLNKFHLPEEQFMEFVLNNYGNSEWFKLKVSPESKSLNERLHPERYGWRNPWLKEMIKHPNTRKIFDHKVELNFNKHNYMKNMTPEEYTLSLITEFYSDYNAKDTHTIPAAWFRIPMLSNKPSSEFIKFCSYMGDSYKKEIVEDLYDIFLQELSRIQTVRMRNLSKNDPGFIKNWDTNGRKFCFLPFLNSYLEEGNPSDRTLIIDDEGNISPENDTLASLLKTKIGGLKELSSEEEVTLQNLTQKAIFSYMETRVNRILDDYEKTGILEAAKSINNIEDPELLEYDKDLKYTREAVRKFLWNDALASKCILQLLTGDIAFYKDTEDLQKRLAQVHAPGIRPNVNATDFEGKKVSDGKYRTVVLTDFDNFISNICDNLAEIFDRKIAAAVDERSKAPLKALKESLVGKDGEYRKINATDAQGFSSPSSRRKKSFLFGKWSKEAEDIYQKLLSGTYTYTDLQTAFQPEKPFLYAMLQKNVGFENSPIQTMPVPFQAKNSEYLLIMADAILKGESTSKPNMLRAIYQVMEDSEKEHPTMGIDTIQFESTIKAGLQGKIDLSPFVSMSNGTEAAITYMKSLIYKDGKYNTDIYVYETPYEHYCIQQEVPEHFKNHSQAHGSQIRAITISDLDEYYNPNGDLSDESNKVYYEFDEPDGTHKKLTADEFAKEYEDTIAQNIQESINLLTEELHLNSSDKKEKNIALSKILQREILGSPRYGIDLLQACSVNKETGEFRIPKGDPVQSKRIEQLINSIIKNRINKQKIAGGPIVQVSNFGTSTQLHIRFKDKQGNLLMTKEEFEQQKGNSQSYKDYIEENQAGIAYFECYIPMWSNDVFSKFMNIDGTIDIQAIEETCPELLQMIGYRIPTEAKYSCAPLKAVGFLPREAGDAIMFPYEITTINDSDFDIDKEYVMRKDIPLLKNPDSEIRMSLFDKLKDRVPKEKHEKLKDLIYAFVHNPEKYRSLTPSHILLWNEYKKIAYYPKVPKAGKLYRDNKIVDMTWTVLTHETSAFQILNPGGFTGVKKIGYTIAAYRANNSLSWEELQAMSIDELKNTYYTEKDLTFADTQVQFYKQNSAAASLIGVFAVNRVAQAILQHDHLFIAVDEICGEDSFTIAGKTFSGHMPLDSKYSDDGSLVGKVLGSFVAASADAVKDPVLNLMNINMNTVNILNALLRLGMDEQKALLFLSQPIINDVLNEYNRQNLTGYASLNSVIDSTINSLKEQYDITDTDTINYEELSENDLVKGLLPEEHDAIDYKTLVAFKKIKAIADAIRKPTFITRFNSISSAVGPLIIDNLIIEKKLEDFSVGEAAGTHFYDRDNNEIEGSDILQNHPMLDKFSKTVEIAASMFSDMPAGSTAFRQILASLPQGLDNKIYNDRKLLSSLSDFFQSYILVASEFIKSNDLDHYIKSFPQWFMKQDFKKKYPNNSLIQAISISVDKKGRAFLNVNTTGMDTQQKETLSSAWTDLHKSDPILSKYLFSYCFFRGGIGFTPKTFMSLVPIFVKEHLSSTTENGENIFYADVFRQIPSIVPETVIDQFISNNWSNNKLVPKKGKDNKFSIDFNTHTLYVRDSKDLAELKGVPYMKITVNQQTTLWKRVYDGEYMIYKEIPMLGGKNDFLEISSKPIAYSIEEYTEFEEVGETGESQLSLPEPDTQEVSNLESDIEETSLTPSDTEQAKNLDTMVDAIMQLDSNKTKETATQTIQKIKKHPNQDIFKKYLQNVFQKMNLNIKDSDILKEFNKYC